MLLLPCEFRIVFENKPYHSGTASESANRRGGWQRQVLAVAQAETAQRMQDVLFSSLTGVSLPCREAQTCTPATRWRSLTAYPAKLCLLG